MLFQVLTTNVNFRQPAFMLLQGSESWHVMVNYVAKLCCFVVAVIAPMYCHVYMFHKTGLHLNNRHKSNLKQRWSLLSMQRTVQLLLNQIKRTVQSNFNERYSPVSTVNRYM
jgi:hypothetical protein